MELVKLHHRVSPREGESPAVLVTVGLGGFDGRSWKDFFSLTWIFYPSQLEKELSKEGSKIPL